MIAAMPSKPHPPEPTGTSSRKSILGHGGSIFSVGEAARPQPLGPGAEDPSMRGTAHFKTLKGAGRKCIALRPTSLG
jgi:hypothetical protein